MLFDKSKKKRFFFLLLLFGLVPSVIAYEIVDDRIIQEDNFSRLEVYPYLSWNPLDKNYFQTFELTNKTAQSRPAYLAYIFDYPLQWGLLEIYVPAIFGWIQQTTTCAPPYIYDANLNYYPDQQNPHHIRCYDVRDNNIGGDFNFLVFDLNFNDYNFQEYRIFFDLNGVVGGNSWNNVTQYIDHTEYLGRHFYYYDSAIVFDSNETKKWRIKYTPHQDDNSGKWDLVYLSDEDPLCLLDNSCDYVNRLDPWFDSEFKYKRKIELSDANANDVVRIDFNSDTVSDFGEFFAASSHSGNAVAFVNSVEDTKLFSNKNFWNADSNAQYDVNIGTSTDFVYVYYGNDINTLDQSQPCDTYFFYDGFDDGSLTVGCQAWTIFTGTWIESGSLAQETSAADHNKIYVDYGSNFDYSNGIGIFEMKADVGSDISFEIDDDSPAGATSELDGYRVIVDFGLNEGWKLEKITGGNNSNVTSPITTNSQAGDIINATRNATGIWQSFRNSVIVGIGTDTAHTIGRYFSLVSSHSGGVEQSHFDFVKFHPQYFFGTYSIGDESGQPDVNWNLPSGGYFNGTIDLNFYVQDIDTNAVNQLFDINFAPTQSQGTGTSILNDGNVATIPNLFCDSNDFSVRQMCYYSFDSTVLNDGNYFVLIDMNDGASSDFNASDFNLVVDNTKPSTSWDGNIGVWQITDANVHLTCIDDYGCKSTYFSIDENAFGLYDTNILVSWDGNTQLRFYSIDITDNVGDTNTQFVLIDKTAPIIDTIDPASDTQKTGSPHVFTFDYIEPLSGVAICHMKVFDADTNELLSDNNRTPASSTRCTETVSFAVGQKKLVQATAYDNLDNKSSDSNSGAIERIAEAENGNGGGGGGGSAVGVEPVVVPSIIQLTPSTLVIELFGTIPKSYFVTALSLADQNLNIEVLFSDEIKDFMVLETDAPILLPHETKIYRFIVQAPDENFSEVTGKIVFSINEGQHTPEIELTIKPSEQPFILGLFFAEFFGIPVLYWLGIFGFLYFVYSSVSKKKKA